MHHIALVECKKIYIIRIHLAKNVVSLGDYVIGHPQLIGYIDVKKQLFVDRALSKYRKPQKSEKAYCCRDIPNGFHGGVATSLFEIVIRLSAWQVRCQLHRKQTG